MGDLLQRQALEKLVLNEDLLDTSISGELKTAKILVCSLHVDLNLVVLAEATDLLEVVLKSVDEYEVLGLGLDK